MPVFEHRGDVEDGWNRFVAFSMNEFCDNRIQYRLDVVRGEFFQNLSCSYANLWTIVLQGVKAKKRTIGEATGDVASSYPEPLASSSKVVGARAWSKPGLTTAALLLSGAVLWGLARGSG